MDRGDMLTALQSPEVRRVLIAILKACNVAGQSYAPGDSLATAYNEGLRAGGIWLMHEINKVDPEALPRLLKEWLEERNNG